MRIVEQYLLQLKKEKSRRRRAAASLSVLSLIVAISVAWSLRITGVTLVNDACCGHEEHQHTEECLMQSLVCTYDEEDKSTEETELINSPEHHIHVDECYQSEYQCGYDEHLHNIACYSNPKADVETLLDWQAMFEDYPFIGNLREDLVGVAKTQIGYTESELNFQADDEEVRHGYTRYGAWYGAPYNKWSAMFVSFCLHYAGADLNEYPISSGADTMANLWDKQGKYVPCGQYIPANGDLVFFEDNTVGIVSEVQNATIYVISGDEEDAVSGRLLSINDDSIDGWGIIDDSLPEDALAGEDSIKEGLKSKLNNASVDLTISVNESNSSQLSMLQEQQNFLNNTQDVTDLMAYLTEKEGSYFLTLTDSANRELPKDEQGNYIAQTNTDYQLSFSFKSPNGFLPGTYQYQLPRGLVVYGVEGDCVINGDTNVGSWSVSDAGLITLSFNENMNIQSDITISVGFLMYFTREVEQIDFDVDITVIVKKPPESQEPTKLNKWGVQGKEEEKQDPTKIYWTLEITGQKDSQIPGSILMDQPTLSDWSSPHSYTQSDIDGGLTFGASDPNEDWHAWTVYADDPNLNWTEAGWTYKMPESIKCPWCPEPITLGNEGWTYYVEYTSTPEPTGTVGKSSYTNSVTIDGQQFTGWGEFIQGETGVGVVKNGAFHGDANGGKFLWEFQVTIPGRKDGERAAYYTQIMDHLRVKDPKNATIAYATNDADKATVTAVYNGQTIPVPNVADATAEDQFAWVVGWSGENGGIEHTRALLPLCRCNCTAESCHYWDAEQNCCGAFHYVDKGWGASRSDFCYCWTYEQNLTFTFSYMTDDSEIIENYGGQGFNLQNEVVLQHTVYDSNGTEQSVTLGDAVANVPIPGVFKKELTKDFDGYTAHYQITINEAKVTLTDGSPLTIHDAMTETLAYISGSLVVTAEDVNGNQTILQQGIDYTVEYDGTGNETDQAGNKVHVLDIVILRPQPVTYILDYDTTLVIPEHLTEAIKYSNSASVTLWGKTITAGSTEKTYSNFNISAKSYSVELFKTDAQTNHPLAEAEFGFYNAQGGLIDSDTTSDNGKILFRTNIMEGVIMREHVLYYVQELQPPKGYLLDDKKHWFVFCNVTNDSCETCNEVLGETHGVRIPLEQIGIVHVTNQFASYELPSTGGLGDIPYMLCGLMLISAPLVYGLSLRHKHRRRENE